MCECQMENNDRCVTGIAENTNIYSGNDGGAHTTNLNIPTTMSSFAPDADLELLFDPELILADVKAQIGHDLHVRHCSASTVQHTDPHIDAFFSQDRLHLLRPISSLCPHHRVLSRRGDILGGL